MAARNTATEIAFLTRALKAPRCASRCPDWPSGPGAESWTHEEFLAVCLQREVAACESHAGEGRIRAASFLARKSLEGLYFDHARGLRREVTAHLGTLDFVTVRDNMLHRYGGFGGFGTHNLVTRLVASGLVLMRASGQIPIIINTKSGVSSGLAETVSSCPEQGC